MSIVSSYPASAYPANSPASDVGNSSMMSTSPNSSPFYGHPHHHQTVVSIGDYSSGGNGLPHQHHQGFYASPGGCWTWPNGGNGVQSAVDYQQQLACASHVHQQPSPPLSSYSSSAPSPDYYTFGNVHHQQQSQQHQTYDNPIDVSASLGEEDQIQQHNPSTGNPPQRVVRIVKRRNTANKKERRRTMSINNAFSELRDCIPNVPADTKLSKIKTLRLATSYISYLMTVLEAGSDTDIPFRAELGRQTKNEKLAAQQMQQQQQQQQQQQHQQNKQQQHLTSPNTFTTQNCCNNKDQAREEINSSNAPACPSGGDKRTKGRTGWPHHVWALELKQ